MDLRSLFCLSPCRLILGLACTWMLSAESNAQTILFHETFDSSAGFTSDPVNFDADVSNNGSRWSYWGIWDPIGATDDFGSGPVPDPGPSFTNVDGNALIGREMNGGGNGNGNSADFIASPGIVEWYDLDVENWTALEFSIALAAYRTGNPENNFNENDFVRISWRDAGALNWTQVFELSGIPLQNVGPAFVSSSFPVTTNWENVDLRLEMMVTQNVERLGVDDFKLVGCADLDTDNICDEVDDCVGTIDACDVCNGPGAIYDCGCSDIPSGDCDCNGNQLDALDVCGGDCLADADDDGICDDVDDCVGLIDALGVCGGGCAADADDDGICDDVDDCVGALDACGVCNGPGDIYACGCSEPPNGDCDCEGNQADALGVCGGDCESDADNDGVCDDVDPCVGAIDACGVCNGPGAIYECGCAPLPEGYCDCANSPIDAIGECGGDCAADADSDGVCDDEDDCIGELDECGVCNGPGEIYDCGCSEIPDGDCDCDGVQFDALGICGGLCESDADADGVCDDVDPCVGELDACGVCNGPGEVYECGCADIPEGACDCSGTESEEVIVTIIPDNYGSEITWEIQDAEDNVVLSGGPYTNSDTDAIVVSAPLCPACYTFTIYDSWGDGLDPNGGYSVISGGDTLIQGSGNYGFGESSGICILNDCGLCGEDCLSLSLAPGPLSGGTYETFTFALSPDLTLQELGITLNAQGGNGDNYASDLLMAVVDPAGNGVEWGGFDVTFGNGYTEAGAWPASWESAAESGSPWSATVDLSAGNLSGAGTWTVYVANGWLSSAQGMTYNVDLSICDSVSGCTDETACNYDAEATTDDGSCIDPHPELGCCSYEG
ncbi:MAG: hypothetical protein L7S67_10010, partial [Flavobacteriales bacterium]|nr:hypothetical protein [Flavobacteriales bacterium]